MHERSAICHSEWSGAGLDIASVGLRNILTSKQLCDPMPRVGMSADMVGVGACSTSFPRVATLNLGRIQIPWFVAITLLSFQPVLLAGSSLVEAARNGDWIVVRSMIADDIDVATASADGSTALHWAAYHDDVESVDLLIAAGCDLNARTDLGVTALWAASENGSGTIARALLDAGADADAALLSGETPLMVAARSGYPNVVGLLLAAGADPDARATRGQTALMWAASQKHSEVVRVLLDGGASVDARSEEWRQVMALPPHGYLDYNRAIPHGRNTALMFAARSGDLDSARLLVDAGADVDDTDAWGVSATTMAAHSGFTELVEFLLDSGADPNHADAGFAALHIAVMRRDLSMIRALLEHGADPNVTLETWTPTRRSSRDYHFKPALVGATPFWLAARFLQPDAMLLLLEHGADPLVVHRSDYVTGQSWKRRVERTTLVTAALGMGGGSAWFEPASENRERLTLGVVRLALNHGADVNLANTDGKTALEVARAKGFQSVADLLIDHGAR